MEKQNQPESHSGLEVEEEEDRGGGEDLEKEQDRRRWWWEVSVAIIFLAAHGVSIWKAGSSGRRCEG